MTFVRLPAVPLEEAVRDQALLGSGVQWFPRQLELFELIAASTVAVLCLGRRSGKTLMCAAVMVHAATLRPELRGALRPDEVGHVVGVGVNVRQSRLLLEAARSLLRSSPVLRELIVGETEDEISLSTGFTIAAFPAAARGVRGWAVPVAVLDEAAHHLEPDGVSSAGERLWTALWPAVVPFAPHGQIILASTPNGGPEVSWFAGMFERTENGELGPHAVAVRAPTAEINLQVTEEMLAVERERDPSGFEQEFEALFAASGGQFIAPERIAEAVVDRAELEPSEAGRTWIGFDPSFSQDPAAAVVVAGRPDGTLQVAAARSFAPLRSRSAGMDEKRSHEDRVLDEVAELYHRFGARQVISDQYMAVAVADALTRRGCRTEIVPITSTSKTRLLGQVKTRILGRTLELYPHEGLLRDLRALRVRYGGSGPSVLTPRLAGSHCDLAVALSLAVHGHDRDGIVRGHGHGPTNRLDGGAIARLDELDAVFSHPTSRRTRRWYDPELGLSGRTF